MNSRQHIVVIGAGLVGSLLAIYLQKRGYLVDVYERRQDLRKADIRAGKSINLALSNRGWRALAEVGLEAQLKKLIIPMQGRMMHDHDGNLSFQPYGKEGQAINSISRGSLNTLLIGRAEEAGVKFHFEMKCTGIDFDRTVAFIEGKDSSFEIHASLIFGADGAYSAVRKSMQKTDRFDYSQTYISHGYKELSFPPGHDGNFVFEKHALHIWPRGKFMLIALPNLDKSFTVTLFLPFEDKNSFAQLQSNKAITDFFEREFPDAMPYLPDLLTEYHENPAGSLVTIRSYPWVRNRCCLIGDAAHAIVPFYGQGMIAGFEDCYVLNKLLDGNNDNWDTALAEFQAQRKPDTDAIANLAVDNFTVMRDKVADPDFQLQKKIEAHLHHLFPDRWIPLYSMVTFQEDMRYSEALKRGRQQDTIMQEVMNNIKPDDAWQNLNFAAIVERLDKLVSPG